MTNRIYLYKEKEEEQVVVNVLPPTFVYKLYKSSMTGECTRPFLNRDCLLPFLTCSQHHLVFNEDLTDAPTKACELN